LLEGDGREEQVAVRGITTRCSRRLSARKINRDRALPVPVDHVWWLPGWFWLKEKGVVVAGIDFWLLPSLSHRF
jgi:hypothetical protein